MSNRPVYIMVDVETDGPTPSDYSMISIGAVVIEPGLSRTFYGQLQPISSRFEPAALRISGTTRDQSMSYPYAGATMRKFEEWVDDTRGDSKARFVSDNAGFDWMFVCWYFHHFTNRCPFGHSPLSLTSLYKGSVGDLSASLRDTREALTHHPVEDAKANAEVFLKLISQFES